ncbi:hypothetical protein TrVE_jg4340 [Triparma verrucosa]|uniref:Centrosomal protein CEP104 N-terminal domain-containing protein n=1 Tax=Triparma verrucosa TaxID=1606542 RepID=A0A9W7FPK8_9STRA|nr:hypothetical protein TrVE_jg4340 [Triparma verrucosa]
MLKPQYASALSSSLTSTTGSDPPYSSPSPLSSSLTPSSSYWLSPKFCTYPQTLVYRLEHHASINIIRILSHEYCIPSRVDIYVGTDVGVGERATQDENDNGNGGDQPNAKFRRLGFMKFSANESSSYKARELKSVNVNCLADYVKLIIYKPNANDVNLCNQVGIVGIEFVGQYSGQRSAKRFDQAMPPNPPELLEARGGTITSAATTNIKYNASKKDLIRRQIAAVKSSKVAAVDNSDYVMAKSLKQVEDKLITSAVRCDALEEMKAKAVASEDFDRARILKGEIDGLRGKANAMVKGLGIEVKEYEPEAEPEPAPPSLIPPSPTPPSPEAQIPTPTPTPPPKTSLKEEIEADTMMAEDILEQSSPSVRSPRVETFLEEVEVESPRMKRERDVKRETFGEEKDETDEKPPPESAVPEPSSPDDQAVDGPSTAAPTTPPPATPPPSTPPPPLSVKEAVEAKSFIDSQNAPTISPRVSPRPKPKSPTPPPTPPEWTEEEQPREDGGLEEEEEEEVVVPVVVPDGTEALNEISEWEAASEIVAKREAVKRRLQQEREALKKQLQQESAENELMAEADEELKTYYAELEAAEHKLRVEQQTAVIIKVQARTRGNISRSLVDRKRGVRKRTKNAFKLGLKMVKSMNFKKQLGESRKIRIDALQEEEGREHVPTPEPTPPPTPDRLEPLDTLIDDPEVLNRALRSAQAFGTENLQRIHSKDWALREKGFNNVASQLPEIAKTGVESILEQLAHVLTTGIDDKTSECMFSCLNVIDSLESVLASQRTSAAADDEKNDPILVPKLTHEVFCPPFESVIRSLVSRLGDVNSGMADAALQALGQVAKWPEVGPVFVAQVGLKRLFKWEEHMARCVSNRLNLLHMLLQISKDSGGAGAGVLAAASLKFANDAGAFESTNDNISKAAKSLEEIALGMMGDNAGMLIGDLKGVSLLAELQRAERQRHMRLEKLCENAKTKTMDLEHLGEAVDKVSRDVEESAVRVEAEVDAVFDLMQQRLNERRAEVKKMLSDIGGGKGSALGKQREEIQELKKNMEDTSKMARNALDMLHQEEYNAMIEPLTKHLEALGDQHSKLQRDACDDASIVFVAGGREKVLTGILEHFGAIHTSGDVVPGFQKLAGDVGDGRSPKKAKRKKPNADEEDKDAEEEEDYEQLEIGKQIHLTVRALIPRIGDGVTNDEFHKENNGTKDTVVVEIRKGSEKQVAKQGHAGEILGRVIIVNSIEQPPRDDYNVEQYFESLYTQTEILEVPDGFHENDKKLIKNRRDPVTHRSVPTTRFTKLIRFQGDSVWAQKLRKEARTNSVDAGLDWKEELGKVDSILWK